MTALHSVVALCVAATIGACRGDDLPPKPPPYELTDRDAPDSPLGQVCVRLRHLGCPEAYPNRRGRTCFETLSSAAELVPVPLECLRDADSVEAVRECGDANTTRVRCVMPAVDSSGSSFP